MVIDKILSIPEYIGKIKKTLKWGRGEMEGEKLVKPIIKLYLIGSASISTSDEKYLVVHKDASEIVVENQGRSGDVAKDIIIAPVKEPLRIIVKQKATDEISASGFIKAHEFNTNSLENERYLDTKEYFLISVEDVCPTDKGMLKVGYKSKAGSYYCSCITVKKIVRDGETSRSIWWEKIDDKSYDNKLIRKTWRGREFWKCKECHFEKFQEVMDK